MDKPIVPSRIRKVFEGRIFTVSRVDHAAAGRAARSRDHPAPRLGRDRSRDRRRARSCSSGSTATRSAAGRGSCRRAASSTERSRPQRPRASARRKSACPGLAGAARELLSDAGILRRGDALLSRDGPARRRRTATGRAPGRGRGHRGEGRFRSARHPADDRDAARSST